MAKANAVQVRRSCRVDARGRVGVPPAVPDKFLSQPGLARSRSRCSNHTPPHIRSTHTPRASHLRSAGLAWQPDIGGNLTFVACSPDPGKLFGLLETLLRGSPAESLFPRQQTRSARMRFVEVRTATRECDARM